jgi:hypothetical protein
MGWMRALAVLACLACGLAACGGYAGTAGSTGPTAPTPVESPEDFPADASAVHYHPIHHAAFGPLYGSGCPDNGACACEGAKTLAEEFTSRWTTWPRTTSRSPRTCSTAARGRPGAPRPTTPAWG